MVRPKYSEEADVRGRVLDLLPSDGSKVRWIYIEKQARSLRISLRTVRDHLGEAENERLVVREVDVETKPPAVYYRRLLPPSKNRPERMEVEDLLRVAYLWVSEIFLGNLNVYLTSEEFRKHIDRLSVYGGLTTFAGEHKNIWRSVREGTVGLEEVLSTIPQLQKELNQEIENVLGKYESKQGDVVLIDSLREEIRELSQESMSEGVSPSNLALKIMQNPKIKFIERKYKMALTYDDILSFLTE